MARNALLIIFICVFGPIPSRAEEPVIEMADEICGPRCVFVTLQEYGIQEDLLTLVEEIQGHDLAGGSTIASLQSALNARGIHTLAGRVDGNSVISWPHPVIVHLTSETSQGHFVVLLPTSSSNNDIATVRDGLHGARRGDWSSLRRKMSGAVLLTSPEEIPSALSTSALTTSSDTRLIWCLGIQLLLLGSILVCGRWFLPPGFLRKRKETCREGIV